MSNAEHSTSPGAYNHRRRIDRGLLGAAIAMAMAFELTAMLPSHALSSTTASVVWSELNTDPVTGHQHVALQARLPDGRVVGIETLATVAPDAGSTIPISIRRNAIGWLSYFYRAQDAASGDVDAQGVNTIEPATR